MVRDERDGFPNPTSDDIGQSDYDARKLPKQPQA
jgi:hypothetical protein